MAGQLSDREKALRQTILTVDDRPNKSQIVVTIMGWKQNPVTISAAVLSRELYKAVKAGDHLFAKVNIYAKENDDLQFHDINFLPPFDDNGGLC